jgi:predicted secreted hydrolase
VRARLAIAMLGLLAAWPAGVANAADAAGWAVADSTHAWSFPRDHHAHRDYRSEWWYVTGQLAAPGAGEPTHGFQLTFFRLGLSPDDPGWRSDWAARELLLAHAAVTEFASGRHLFAEVLTRPGPGRGGFPAAGDSVLAWSRGPAGTADRWSFRRRAGDGFAITARDDHQGLLIDLVLRPERPRIFQGPGGYSAKDPQAGAGSLYYSYPRLEASGRVAAGADTTAVSGRAWLDREIFTSQLAARHRGWDWLSLQLADGRDLMVFVLRDQDQAPDLARATLVTATGEVRWLDAPLDVLEPRRWWTSPRSGARYPVAWRLRLPAAGIALDLEAVVEDQENLGPRSGIAYWEGAVQAGQKAARGYVELTGYGSGGAPPLR